MIKMEREPLNAMVLYNEETGRKITITAHGNDYLARYEKFTIDQLRPLLKKFCKYNERALEYVIDDIRKLNNNV